MSKTVTCSPATVAGWSGRGRSIAFALLAFGLTAGITYRYVNMDRTPAAAPLSYTATAYVVEPAAKAGASEVRIPLSYTGADSRRAEDVANTLAERYVEDRRIEWKRRMDGVRSAKVEAAALAHQQLEEDEAWLEEFRKQMAAAKSARETSQPATTAATVDNPVWIELEGRLATLTEQRAKLLVDRTPLHPAVQDVTAQMDDVKQQMAGVQRTIAAPDAQTVSQPQADESPPTEQEKQRLAELMAAVEASRRKCDEADARQSAVDGPAPQYSVVRACVTADSLMPEERSPGGWMPLLAGTLMAFGVGFVSLGSSIRPVCGSIGQVRADAGVPVLGEVPACEPVENPRRLFERQCTVRRNLVGLGLLLITACPLAVLWATTVL